MNPLDGFAEKKMKKLLYILKIIAIALFFANMNLYAKSTFTGEDIKIAAIEYVESITPDNYEVEVLGTLIDKTFRSDDIEGNFKKGMRDLRGITSITLEFAKNGKRLDAMSIPIRVKIFKEVPVAKSNIKVGEQLNGKYEVYRVDISSYREEQLISADAIKNAVCKRFVSKGKVISREKITYNSVITRGEPVEIVVVAGAVQVFSTGTAITDAAPGEKVRVKKNGNKNKVLTGWAGEDGRVYIKAR